MIAESDLRAVSDIVAGYGDLDLGYMDLHARRFALTLGQFTDDHPECAGRSLKVLDVGAHWLHQSLLWQQAGFEVTALDLPVTFAEPAVRTMAADHRIELLEMDDIGNLGVLAGRPNDFDVILFTEVLEHLVINPVAMWDQLLAALKPGGRIVITTPNYYCLLSLLKRFSRFMAGNGGSVPVQQLLAEPGYYHHWKEYSARELADYFQTLSPDLRIDRLAFHDPYRAGGRSRAVFNAIYRLAPPLRPNLYVDVCFDSQDGGTS